MTPLFSALLAVGWLALISAYFWWHQILVSRASVQARPVPSRFHELHESGTSRAGRR
jgi:hypothetical protein